MLALLPYAGILSALLLAAILGGSAALRLTPTRGAARAVTGIFVSLLAAGILVATCTAVWYTDSRTVLLLATVPIAVSIFTLPNRDGGDAAPSRTAVPWREILLACAVGFLLFLPHAANLAPLGPGPLPLRIPHPDEVFLARVGACAARTGQETLYACGSEYHSDFRGAVPYHYFEIWIAVGFARFTGLPVVVSYTLLTLPYLACTAIFGLWAVAEAAGASGWRLRAALAFAPFLPGPVWLLPESSVLSRGARGFAFPPLEMTGKSLVLYSFGALAFLLVLRRKPLLASMALCVLAPLSVVGAPAAAGGILLAAVTLRNEWRALVVVLATAVAMALGFAVFYLVLGNHAIPFVSPLRIVADNVDIGSLRTKLNIAGKSILQIAMLYAPHLLTVAVVLARRRSSECFVAAGLAGAFIGGGVLGYAAFSRELLSFEFATVPAAPSIYLLLTVVLAKESANLVWRAATTALLILGAGGFALVLARPQSGSTSTETGSVRYVAQYSASYLTAVAAAHPISPLGGFVVGPGDIGERWDESKPIPAPFLNTYTLGAPLVFLDRFAGPTFLGEDAVSLKAPEQITPFLRYRRQLEPRGSTLDEILDRFLDEVRLGYVIVSKGATIPTPIARRCTQSFLDPPTGERFLLLAPVRRQNSGDR